MEVPADAVDDIPEMPIAEEDEVEYAAPKKKRKSVRTYVQKQPKAYV